MGPLFGLMEMRSLSAGLDLVCPADGNLITASGTRFSLAPDGVFDAGGSVTALAILTSNLNNSGYSATTGGGESNGSGLTSLQDFVGKARTLGVGWELAVGAKGWYGCLIDVGSSVMDLGCKP